MKERKNCKHSKKGHCKKKGFKVSINANWCKDYKVRLLIKIFRLWFERKMNVI